MTILSLFALRSKQLRTSIFNKLLFGFVTVLLLLLFMAGMAWLTLFSYRQNLQVARALDLKARNAQSVQNGLSLEAIAFTDLLVRREAELSGNYEVENRSINASLKAFAELQLPQVEKDQVDFIVNLHKQVEQLYSKALDQATSNDYIGATRTWDDFIHPQLNLISANAGKLADQFVQEANDSSNQAEQTETQNQIWLALVLGVGLILSILIAFITIRTTVSQNQHLQVALQDVQSARDALEARSQSNHGVSRDVLSLAGELKNIAVAQTSGSQHQVEVVVQVNTSIEELALAANYISSLAEQINATAQVVTLDSYEIENTTSLSVNRSKEGMAAINQTVDVSSEVADLYQQLVDTLSELNAKSAIMQRVLVLLRSLSTETHLLSLNAAIEAAGAGEFGERFKVIAQQVKNLASRSTDASEEVVQIIQEVAQMIDSAAVSATSGGQKARNLALVANGAGEVIAGMREISEKAQNQASNITQVANEVKKLTEVIKTATTQQRLASEHVLEALTGLSSVAQQNANGSALVSSNANNLEEVSSKLTLALAL